MAEQTKATNTAAALGALGVLVAVAVKFKAAIFAALKAGWLLKTSGTMLLSFGVYTVAFGWQWAAMIVAQIYVHEMGHYVFMKAKGLNPSAPVFVPFVGAYVAMKNLPNDPVLNAWVAYAGPLAGGWAACGLYYWGLQTGSNFLLSAASWGFIINLLQLIPVRPFDGGFMAACISKWLCIPGAILLIILAFHLQSLLLGIISVVAVYMAYRSFRNGNQAALDRIPFSERLQIAALYFGSAWALGYLYWNSEGHLKAFLR